MYKRQDVLTGEIIDHFGGQEDLKKGVLRHVNPHTFAEDPLRVLRAAQFAARFSFSIAPETIELSRKMDLTTLAHERVTVSYTHLDVYKRQVKRRGVSSSFRRSAKYRCCKYIWLW